MYFSRLDGSPQRGTDCLRTPMRGTRAPVILPLRKRVSARLGGNVIIGGRIFACVLMLGALAALAQESPPRLMRPADLAHEAKDVPAEVAALFRELASPADQVVRADRTPLTVEPIAVFIGARPDFAGTL